MNDEVDEATHREQLVQTLTSGDEREVLNQLEKLTSTEIQQMHSEFDLEENFSLKRILTSFVQLSQNQHIKLRATGITLEDVSVYGVDERFAVIPTVSNVLQLPLTIYRAIRAGKPPNRTILNKFNVLAKPGDMVLVLGRPGSGCTSLLKTIGGCDLQLFTGVEGDITYDGIDQKTFLKHFKPDLIYNSENDVHFPHLTVEQTLKFAIACKTPNLRINNVSRQEFIDKLTLVLATVFGLRHCLHTNVGNEFIRGVSGGERKRVSIAEALACRGSIYCWDNATRGLDASTALEYTEAIRTMTSLLKSTAFITLYQAGENVYQNFDKVTVLYSGRQIFYGPIDQAKTYFENMGWHCPARQTTAEFLTAVTDPIGRFKNPHFEGKKIPETAEEMEEYWLKSEEYRSLKQEIADYKKQVDSNETNKLFRASLNQEKQKFARDNSDYIVNFTQQLKLTTERAWQRTWGDKYYTVSLIIAAIVQGFIAGSMYYNLPQTVAGAFSRGGTIFFTALYVTLMGLAEVSASFTHRPILMKHKNYSLYHLSTEALGSFFLSVPVSLIVTVFFVIIIYFLSNLAREAGKFFIVVLFVFLLQLVMLSLFRAIASLTPAPGPANAVAGVFILSTLTYSSYMIQRPSMHPWFKWISYINPILYSFEAMISSEFHGRKMECTGMNLIPAGPGYTSLASGEQACSFIGSVLGQSWVSGDRYLDLAFTYRFTHVWRNFGILIGFLVFLLGVNCLGMEFVRPVQGGADRLLFLRDRVPEAVVLGKETSDLESNGSSSTTIDETVDEAKADVFEDLKSKDVFVWQNVTYTIPYNKSERVLLDDISGYCVPGTLTALMGESGAGKTTLLNTLAQRIDMGVVTGDMLVNGNPLDNSFMRRTGYVMQQDIHVSESTVRESLVFAARLRRANVVPDSEKVEYVEKIIKILGMSAYADAIVGEQGSGLNVEQRKKLSIAVELVAKPSLLLFLDEPTSGLDSQSAWAIVKMLRDLANAGQSILCTIHQPSATLFEEFDRLLLLRKGGQTVYFGKIGENSRIMLDYFESNGARKCNSNENPAEYMLETIGAGATASTDRDWFEVWSNSSQKQESVREGHELLEKYNRASISVSPELAKEMNSTYAAPYWYQFLIVLERTAHVFYRDLQYIMSKIFLQTFAGLFLGFTFFGLEYTLTGAQNSMFVSFLSVVVSAPLINQMMSKAIIGRELFETREKKSRTYHWSLMIFSQFLTEIPYLFVGAAIMFVSLYFPTKSNFDGPHAGVFYLTHGIFLQLFAISFAMLIIYQAPDLETAGVIFGFLYTFVVSFSGIVQPSRLLPGFWKFMWRLSPFTYYIGNLVGAILHGRPIKCNDVEMAKFHPPSGMNCGTYMKTYIENFSGYIVNPEATDICGYCPYDIGDQYLANINVKYSNTWRNLGFFVAYVCFNLSACCLIYWALRFKKWRKK
jgi:ATP-binding cassette subfamily G (WHITE) protein 2 (SNQ2)